MDEKVIKHDLVTGQVNEGVPTNVANPTRATVRTVVQNVVSDLIILVPLVNVTLVSLNAFLVEQTDVAVPTEVFVAINGGIVVTKFGIAIVTRVMAIPGVADFIQRRLPWLAPIPR